MAKRAYPAALSLTSLALPDDDIVRCDDDELGHSAPWWSRSASVRDSGSSAGTCDAAESLAPSLPSQCLSFEMVARGYDAGRKPSAASDSRAPTPAAVFSAAPSPFAGGPLPSVSMPAGFVPPLRSARKGAKASDALPYLGARR